MIPTTAPAHPLGDTSDHQEMIGRGATDGQQDWMKGGKRTKVVDWMKTIVEVMWGVRYKNNGRKQMQEKVCETKGTGKERGDQEEIDGWV